MNEEEIINDIISKIVKIGEWKHRGALRDIQKIISEQLSKPENEKNLVLTSLSFYISGLYHGLGFYYDLKENEREN